MGRAPCNVPPPPNSSGAPSPAWVSPIQRPPGAPSCTWASPMQCPQQCSENGRVKWCLCPLGTEKTPISLWFTWEASLSHAGDPFPFVAPWGPAGTRHRSHTVALGSVLRWAQKSGSEPKPWVCYQRGGIRKPAPCILKSGSCSFQLPCGLGSLKPRAGETLGRGNTTLLLPRVCFLS